MSLGLAKYYSDAISDNVKRSQEQKIRRGEWLSKAPWIYVNVKKLEHDFNVKWIKGTLGKTLSNSFYHGTTVIKNKSDPHR